MLIIGRAVVRDILDGDDARVVDLVRHAYLLHEQGRTSLPHSVFLRFPQQPRDRIIGLPAYLGADPPVSGIKWISSFPGNLAAGLERASAAILLNSMRTGHPVALVEARSSRPGVPRRARRSRPACSPRTAARTVWP